MLITTDLLGYSMLGDMENSYLQQNLVKYVNKTSYLWTEINYNTLLINKTQKIYTNYNSKLDLN